MKPIINLGDEVYLRKAEGELCERSDLAKDVTPSEVISRVLCAKCRAACKKLNYRHSWARTQLTTSKTARRGHLLRF